MFFIGLALAIQSLLVGILIFIDKYKNKIIIYLQSSILLINLLGYYLLYRSLDSLNIGISTGKFIYTILYVGVAFTFMVWGLYSFMYISAYKSANMRRVFFNKRTLINSLLVGFAHISILSILSKLG